jgi:hypothetical protein
MILNRFREICVSSYSKNYLYRRIKRFHSKSINFLSVKCKLNFVKYMKLSNTVKSRISCFVHKGR